MSEKIKVKIIEGVIAKEVNPFGKEPSINGAFKQRKWNGRSADEAPVGKLINKDKWKKWCDWRKAEEFLRTFEIDLINSSDNKMKPQGKKWWWEVGQILTAHISEIYEQPKNGINGEIIIL